MKKNEKLQQLINLGGIERKSDWADYIALGFTSDDIPYLIEHIANPEFNKAPETSNEVWVPLHAWRTLGQLKNIQCVEPLLALLDTVLIDDDWALEELPDVFGMIGSPCAENLNKYLKETQHDEFSRVIAADGLKRIAQIYPHERENILARLTHFLNNTSNDVDSLNSLIISMLVDLNAVECIDTIRDICKTDKVDISCAGDIENIEIELGIRTERETPKPFYGKNNITPPISPDRKDENLHNESIPDIYDQIDYYLSQYGNDDSILNISELDGFFAAIGCSPEVIMPSQWMPAIWGGEDNSPNWPDKEEAQSFINVCMTYYNEIMESLHQHYYEPLFMERIVKNKTHIVVDEWSNGFLTGVNLWQPLSATDAGFLTNAIEPMQLFSTEKGWEKLNTMPIHEIENWQRKIPTNVINIHQRFVKSPSPQNYQPVIENRTGRNDPCPCRSGKKFKKCCLH